MIPSHAALPLPDVKRIVSLEACAHVGFEVWHHHECDRCRATLKREADEARVKGWHGMADWIDPDV